MRVVYVQGPEGVSGLGLLGALIDAGAPLATVQETWRRLQLPTVQLAVQRQARRDCTATCLGLPTPSLDAFLARHTYTSLCDLIKQQTTPARLTQRLLQIVAHFTDALSSMHGEQDRDIALQSPYMPILLYLASGITAALEVLSIDQIVAAPINLGANPNALATALVRGATVYGEQTAHTLTTIDGVAILVPLSASFGPLPMIALDTTGHGASLDTAGDDSSGLQAIIGETDCQASADRIAVMETNIDDMNPEFYEMIFERLFAQGALDVTLTPILMKKGRPAHKLTVLAPAAAVNRLSRTLLQETSTFGVRGYDVWRQKLDRSMRQVETCYGMIPVKCGVLDGNIVQAAPEYEACKRKAVEQKVPVRLVYAEAARLAAVWLTGAQA
ncbi:MAG: LarC family nickel insertion protein [bacterium]|nr:LarC family nickel insertion protein [bacterium]